MGTPTAEETWYNGFPTTVILYHKLDSMLWFFCLNNQGSSLHETSNITQHQVAASQTYSLHSLEVLLQCEWATRAVSFHAIGIMQTTPLIVEAEEFRHRIKFMVQNYSCGESVISLSLLRLESPFFIQKIIQKKRRFLYNCCSTGCKANQSYCLKH